MPIDRLTPEQRKQIELADAAERAKVASLEGATIISAEWIKGGEGSYVLRLSDGRVVTFTSNGDDMTFTSCEVEKPC